MPNETATAPTTAAKADIVKISSLRSDDRSDEAGEWVDLPEVPGASLLVRPLDYPLYTLARTNLFQRLARAYGRNPTPQKVLIPALGKIYAEHILLGWRGFDVEYSQDMATERLTDWSWRKLTAQVEYAAGTLSDIKVEFVEAGAKNSGVPSAGS